MPTSSGVSTGESISDEALDDAASQRFVENKDWKDIAASLTTAEATLRAARRSERWGPLVARYEVALAEIKTHALRQLEEAIREGKAWAIERGLTVSIEPQPQTHNLNVKGELDVIIDSRTDEERAAGMLSILADTGNVGSGGDGGETPSSAE